MLDSTKWLFFSLMLAGFLSFGSSTVKSEIVLNEIVARNEQGLLDEDGLPRDWIEIHNTGASEVNLEGHYLTDQPEDLEKWEIPNVTLGTGGYLVIFASDNDRGEPGRELHTNFKLNNAGEFLALVAPDGHSILSQFSPAFPPLGADVAYGRISENNALDILAAPTPGTANSGAATEPAILSFTVTPDRLAIGDSLTFSWDTSNGSSVEILGVASELAPAGSLVTQINRPTEYTLKVSNARGVATGSVAVFVSPDFRSFKVRPSSIDPGGRVVLSWDAAYEDRAELADGYGPLLTNPLLYTPFNHVIVPRESTWRYLADGADQGDVWKDPDFDDAAWESGAGIFGLGIGSEETILPANRSAAYFRKSFVVENPAALHGISLRLLHDDGALVYLNGEEIIRSHMPPNPVSFSTRSNWNVRDNAEHAYVEFEIDRDKLISGSNLLAVEVHDWTLGGNFDRAFDASITAYLPNGIETQEMVLGISNEAGVVSKSDRIAINDNEPPSPLSTLAITEILWEIDGTFPIDRHRFVEILNTGTFPVNLAAGVQLTGNAWFDFSESTFPILNPGEYILVVANREVFEAEWGAGYPIAGEFGNAPNWTLGHLAIRDSNGYEIERIDGETQSAAHGFPEWFHTFERIDPHGDANDPANWRASSIPGGSPGEAMAPILTEFSANFQYADPGDTITLFWTVEGANSVRIAELDQTFPGGVGSVDVHILPGEGTRTYQLTATAERATVSGHITVRVAPHILSFTATPESIKIGDPVTLSWELTSNDAGVFVTPGEGTRSPESAVLYPLQRTLIGRESIWRYHDTLLDLGTAWKEPDFDDRHWSEGNGIFGYGNNIEQTIIDRRERLLVYFRNSFEVANLEAIGALYADLLIDDGAQVFLNGIEVLRENLPPGGIGWNTPSAGASPTDGREYIPFELDPGQLTEGTNVIAVGVHNNSPNSDDIGFDLRLRSFWKNESNVHTFTMTAENPAGSASSQVSVILNGPQRLFADWAVGHGFDPGQPEGDSDHDELSNLMEFATGTNPNEADAGNPLNVWLEDGYLSATYPQDLTSAGVELSVEISRNLKIWEPLAGEFSFVSSLVEKGSSIATKTLRSPVRVASAGLAYFRLKASISE